jgi:STE24 endopeptidase
VFLGAYLLHHAVETALLVVNLRRAARLRGVPAALSGVVDEETAQRSRAYVLARGRLSLVEGTFGAAVTLAVLLGGALPWLDRTLAGLGLSGPHLFVAYVATLSAVGSLLATPFNLYGTFVIEERFGFNRATLALWLVDHAKSLGLQAALGLPLLYAVYGFMRFTGSAWWLWVFAFLVAVQVFLLWLWPSFIAPIFNRFEPLPPGPLRERLEALAREAGFRNRGLYVMDASRRSGHSNAYFTGLFRPRIVLFDTLVDRMDVDEAASVLAHEIGHYRERHVHRRLAGSLAVLLASLFGASLLLPWAPLYAAFGFQAASLHAGLALLFLCGGAFLFWMAPLTAGLSRRHEFQADRYAVRLARAPGALKRALLRLSGENLSNPDPHPWYVAWHYTHPPLPQRLARIDAVAAAEAGGPQVA